MAIDIDNDIIKDGCEHSAATAQQPAEAAATTGIHFVNGFNSSLFEYELQSSGGTLFAAHLNGLTVKTKAIENTRRKWLMTIGLLMPQLEMKDKEKEFDGFDCESRCDIYVFIFVCVFGCVMFFVFAVFFLLVVFCFLTVIFVLNFFYCFFVVFGCE